MCVDNNTIMRVRFFHCCCCCCCDFSSSKDAAKTLEQSRAEGRQAGESIQRLEEELEVADARWKAAQEQLAAADRREKR